MLDLVTGTTHVQNESCLLIERFEASCVMCHVGKVVQGVDFIFFMNVMLLFCLLLGSWHHIYENLKKII